MRLAILFAFVVLLLAVPAHGQVPPDVPLKQVGGLYDVVAEWPPEPDAAIICCARVDVAPPADLGCVTTHEPYVTSDGVTHDAAILTVGIPKTKNDDAEVRCTAADGDGNVSDPSPNAGIADFTPPSPPIPLR